MRSIRLLASVGGGVEAPSSCPGRLEFFTVTPSAATARPRSLRFWPGTKAIGCLDGLEHLPSPITHSSSGPWRDARTGSGRRAVMRPSHALERRGRSAACWRGVWCCVGLWFRPLAMRRSLPFTWAGRAVVWAWTLQAAWVVSKRSTPRPSGSAAPPGLLSPALYLAV